MLLVSILLCCADSFAQQSDSIQVLALESAIDLALKNNRSIQIQSKLTEVAENSVYWGNSGLLPTINLIGAGEYTNNETDLTIRTFQPIVPEQSFDESGVTSTTISAVVQADYTVFAGFSGRYRYQLLQTERSIARLEQESLVNRTVVQVTTLFGEIVKLQSREELLGESIKIDQERITKARDKFQFGKATGLEVLRAKTDLNIDSNSLEEVLLAKDNLIKQLNLAIGLNPETTYRVSIVYQETAPKDELVVIQELKQNNPDLMLIQQGQMAFEQQLALRKSAYLPQVNAFANYGYFNQENDLQQLASIENLGYTVGLSVRYALFNGNQNRKNVQNAKINVMTQDLRKKDVEESLISQALQELSTLESLQRQLVRREEDMKTFEETFTRTKERYYNGKVTSLDLREAQTALLNAKVEANDTKVGIVQTNIRLNALVGKQQTAL